MHTGKKLKELGKRIRREPKALTIGICFEPLEPRLLLSGSWGAGVDSPSPDTQANTGSDVAQESIAYFESAGPSGTSAQLQNQNALGSGALVDVLAQAPALNEYTAADSINHPSSSEGQVTPSPTTPLTDLNGNASNRASPTNLMDVPGVREIVFVSENVADYEGLIADLQGRQDQRIFEVVTLDSNGDGIAQVSDILAARSDVAAVHFFTHGANGQINLGDGWLNSTTLQQNSAAVAGWGKALSATGDILFYGCNIAADSPGQSLLDDIAQLTSADVAASADLTGSSEQGGDWDLEYVAGALEAERLFSPNLQGAWPHLLAAPTAANNTVTIDEDTAHTFSAGDFHFSDIDGDSLASVQITSLETAGSLKLSGVDVTLNQVIDRADIDAGNLTFVPVADANGSGYASFGFSVNDGTVDSATSYTLTIDVTPINDDPVAVDDHSALAFDGIDDYVSIADSASLTMTNTLTMEAWIKADPSANVNRMIINKEGEYEVALFSDGTINWAFANTDPGWTWYNTGYAVADGAWTHIAVVYDNGAVSTYVNGALVDLYNGSGAIGDAHATLDELRIGGRSNNPVGKYFDGQIDEVRIWNTVRTEGQIQAAMDQELAGGEAGLVGYWNFNAVSGSSLTDLTGNGNTGTLIDGGAGTAGAQWTGYRTDQNTPINITAANGMLSNDIDADGDTLTVTQVNGRSANLGSRFTLPSGANLTVGILGAFIYDPNGAFDFLDAGQTDTDSFTYQIDDGHGGTDMATVRLTVTGTADAPISHNVSASGNEDAISIAITLTGSDVDGTVAFMRLNGLPANGRLYTDAALTTVATTGLDYAATGEALTLYFVPNADWNSTTSFNYVARDDSGLLDASAATATITVNAVNDAPVDGDSSGPGDEVDADPEPDNDVDPIETDPDETLPIEDELPAPEEINLAQFRPVDRPDITRAQSTHPRLFTSISSLIAPKEVYRNDNGSPSAGVGLLNFLKRKPVKASQASATEGASAPVPAELFSTEAMTQELDRIQQQIDDQLALQANSGKLIIGAAAGVGASVFVGYVVWAFRGASLLFAAFSAMPMWRCFDPLPVLIGDDKNRDEDDQAQRREKESQDDEKRVRDLLGSGQALKDDQGSPRRED